MLRNYALGLALTSLVLGGCGVGQGGVCQYRVNPSVNGTDCQSGLECCPTRSVSHGARGTCEPVGTCAAIRLDGGPLPDAGPVDAGSDGGALDAGQDAGPDGGADAGTDAGSDAGSDAGPRDAGPDGGP